jgi:hypothetical protein
MADWTLQVSGVDGFIHLTVGASNRRTIGFPAAEARELARALDGLATVAERLAPKTKEEP